MDKIAYHATNRAGEIRTTGEVIPARMKNVYLVEDETSAKLYADRFGCSDILKVEYDTADMESTWRPAYIDKGKVIKLKADKTAVVIG